MVDASKIENLKTNIVRTLQKMEQADKYQNWSAIHHDHYDWWAAPIDTPSNTYGMLYAVTKEEVADLLSDENWVKNYHRAISLVLKSWGWNIPSLFL